MTALEQIREDQALGAAFRRCEAALPEGWSQSIIGPTRSTPVAWLTHASSWTDGDSVLAEGPTPTEALTALAEALEARTE